MKKHTDHCCTFKFEVRAISSTCVESLETVNVL